MNDYIESNQFCYMVAPETEEEFNKWYEENEKKLYTDNAVRIFRLQEIGLTYREACVVAADNRMSDKIRAEDLGISVQALYNLRRRGLKKIRDAGRTEEEIYGEYAPTFVFGVRG